MHGVSILTPSSNHFNFKSSNLFNRVRYFSSFFFLKIYYAMPFMFQLSVWFFTYSMCNILSTRLKLTFIFMLLRTTVNIFHVFTFYLIEDVKKKSSEYLLYVKLMRIRVSCKTKFRTHTYTHKKKSKSNRKKSTKFFVALWLLWCCYIFGFTLKREKKSLSFMLLHTNHTTP